jgi:hypothetical protein
MALVELVVLDRQLQHQPLEPLEETQHLEVILLLLGDLVVLVQIMKAVVVAVLYLLHPMLLEESQ